MTKLVLINPPTPATLQGFPGCLPQIKTWLEGRNPNTEVEIIDLAEVEEDEDAIVHAVADYEFEDRAYVGITATTATYQSALRTARAIKRNNPEVKIILGGHHVKQAQAPSNNYLFQGWEHYQSEASVVLEHHPEIDIVATGEGERTLEDLVSGKPLHQARGIMFRLYDDSISTARGGRIHELRGEIDELDGDLFATLAKRVRIMSDFAEYKQNAKRQVYDPAREEEISHRFKEAALRIGIDPHFVEQIYKEVIQNCREEQKGIVNGEKKARSCEITGKFAKTQQAQELVADDLDTISIKNFDQEIMEKMRQFGNVNYISATGCPLSCSFCSVGRGKVESKSLSRKIAELEHLVEKFPKVREDERISIQDNFFAKNVEDIRALCEAIVAKREEDPEFYFNWDCQTRVESMTNPALTDLMKQAGCVAVYLGVENFSEEVLQYLNKAHNPRKYLGDARTSVENLLDADIDVHLEYQTGIFLERYETRDENIKALQELGRIASERGKEITVFMSLTVVYPGTDLAYRMFEDGAPRNAFEIFTGWEDQQDELKLYLGRNFAHGLGGIPTGVIDMEAFKSGEIRFCHDKLIAIESYLAEIREIEGIKLFDY